MGSIQPCQWNLRNDSLIGVKRYTVWMIELTPDESRVLGVLIEKAFTTPDQYPLSLNAVVNGANQKNNRDPILTMEENPVFEALESLRGKGLVVRVDTAGSRVNKYRQLAGEALHLRAGEVALLAELLLRGPQTLGELRGRASRMQAMDSLEVTKGLLNALATRDEPLVRELPAAPGSRAERYVQLLCAELHPLNIAPSNTAAVVSRPDAGPSRIDRLEAELERVKSALRKLAAAVGEGDPLQ